MPKVAVFLRRTIITTTLLNLIVLIGVAFPLLNQRYYGSPRHYQGLLLFLMLRRIRIRIRMRSLLFFFFFLMAATMEVKVPRTGDGGAENDGCRW